MATEQKQYDVFISYSHSDRIVAEGICGYLESKRIRCFIDYRDIPKGASWPSVIPPAIRNSGLMLAVFSKDFNASEQTDNEISIAANRKIPVLVFRITGDSFDGTKEYFLTKSNWIEAFPNPQQCFGELYHNICILLGIKAEEAVQPAAAPSPAMSQAAKEDDLVQKGLRILKDEDGDREMAAYYFRKAAKAGNPEGEYQLGMACYQGAGVPQSWSDAISWFTRAAEHGQTDALTQLAKIYHYGIGTERNIMRALELYTQAAEAGNGHAMKALGKVYHTGELGVQDEQRSREYYEQAFDTLYELALGENDADAQQALGNSYLDGEGVKQSYQQAIKMYERAVSNGHAAAYNSLGICYGSGFGVTKDEQKGFDLQLKSARLGCPIAMDNIAIRYNHKGDKVQFWEWLQRGAECGGRSALCSIGLAYWTGDYVDMDVQQAQRWFEKAITAGDLPSMAYLGLMYERGDIPAADGKQKAVQLYKQAAIRGDVGSYVYLANSYRWGNGTKQNDVEAFRWYQKAADVYTEMKARGENHYVEEAGAGGVTFVNFGEAQAQFFGDVFEELATLYREGQGVEHDSEQADKWAATAKLLKGDIDVKETTDIKALEDAATKGNVKAMDKLLNIYEEGRNEDKLAEWATFAVKNRVFVIEADRMNHKDHVQLVLSHAQADTAARTAYIKAYLQHIIDDEEDGNNNYAIYNAACDDYKRGNFIPTPQQWELMRNDAKGLLGLEDYGLFGAGYLRVRRQHFDVLFPDYHPADVAGGNFSNEKDFRLFYVANTCHEYDSAITDMALAEIFSPMARDVSHSAVVASENGDIVRCGGFPSAITNFIYAYDQLCQQYPTIRKEPISFSFKQVVPFCSAIEIQQYCMQSMKALISVRGVFDNWLQVLDNLGEPNKLIDLAEATSDDTLQLLLLSYVELQLSADDIFQYVSRLQTLYFDVNKQGIADELNAYVERLRQNGIAHQLPRFTPDNIPAGSVMNFDEDDDDDDDYDDDNDDYRQVSDDDFEAAEPTADDLYREGEDYYFGNNGREQNYAEAVECYRRAAEQGHPEAQYSLAFCFEKGEGLTANATKAAQWYIKAAEQGHAASQCSIGLMYELGQGVQKDVTVAVKWYRKSAEQGNKYAQCNLGYCLLNGNGVSQNYDEAVQWFRKAAAQDLARAQDLLGDCYYNGFGVQKDLQQAKEWYEKAAAQGNKFAQESLEKLEAELSKPSLHVISSGGRYGYADQNGRVVVECRYTKAKEFVDGVGLVWDEKKMGAYAESGQQLFKPSIACQSARYLGHNLIQVYSGVLYSLCNLEGKDVNYDLFERMEDEFIDGRIRAEKYRMFGKNKRGYINIEGKFIED